MRVEQQPAFVLHARDWRETSLLVEALSRDHGRVGLLARGVRGVRTRTPRSLLQPSTPLLLSWSGRGELATLAAAEASGTPLIAHGEHLLCVLYANELVMRLLTRHDPHPALFDDYADTLARLARAEPAAWTLRRFERDLLSHLGYGLELHTEADSDQPIDADAVYVWQPESGAVRWRDGQSGVRVRGSALRSLASDTMPDSADLSGLRRLMRAVIAIHLDGNSIRAWNLFASGANGDAHN